MSARVRLLRLSLLLLIISACPTLAQDLRFVPLVKFKASNGFAQFSAGSGTLSTTVLDVPPEIIMTMTNVGALGPYEMFAQVRKSDLSLLRSYIRNAQNKFVRRIVRKDAPSAINGKMTTVFEYTEYTDTGAPITTESFVDFPVADLVSVILLAADAVHRRDQGPINLSMVRDRSISPVVMTVDGTEAVGSRLGTRVVVKAPGKDRGFTYVIAQTEDGSYYPARIVVPMADVGQDVVIDGSPQ